ncbi:hypothetical protein LCGC14_2581900 [marine sediment metagenome]|uniref:Uncharacterized protein n=1 Tax=marine sediment metagenome TaxID=412755 RepID=A0A0F9AE43_9ZZZZ
MVDVIIDKEKIRDMLFVCGIKEMKTIITLIRERQSKMSNQVNDLIKMYENDPHLKTATKALDAWYETKKEIDDLL